MTPLKEGQQVLIKNPRNLVSTVVQQRPGDRDLPEKKRRYLVKIEDELYFHHDDIEALAEPSKDLLRCSPEWLAEFQRCLAAGHRFVANNKDMDALQEFSEAGTKVGLVKKLPNEIKSAPDCNLRNRGRQERPEWARCVWIAFG